MTEDSLFKAKMNEFERDKGVVTKLREAARKKIDDDWKRHVEPELNEKIKKIKDEGRTSARVEEIKPQDENPSYLKEEVADKEKRGGTKRYQKNMDLMAAGGLGIVAILLIMSVVCAGGYCGVEKTPLVSNGVVVLDPVTRQPLTEQLVQNIPLQILESQFMLALIGGIIAPMVVRVLKERYDIEIEESQVSMIVTDAMKAVRLYQNEANRFRDENGRIPPGYSDKLKDLAFESIKANYTDEKYKSIVANVGAQVFEKAIKEAVKRNWIENFPLEKKQVEETISQSIDALPQIIDWKNQNDEVKKAFLDGHVRRLLHNLNVEGWAYDQLNEVFEAEANKRLVAAAIADGKKLLSELPPDKKYLKYTSAVLVAVGESLGKAK